MASTPIYNWPTPDNTGLVKNGALDMRTLGNAIDTTMATMTPKSLVDAKGDLIAATANDIPARLPVGANGETPVADSSTSTGLRYTAGNVNQNPVLNSAMQVWQRGTSFSVAASSTAYTADRWQVATQANQASTISRQTVSDTTNLPNIQYALRVQRNSGQTGTGGLGLGQSIESVNSIPYAGKTVTLSFYARAGANYSPTGNGFFASVYTGTGTDQNVLVFYTGSTQAFSTSPSLTTTWTRYTATGTISSTATELGLYMSMTPTGTAGANDWYEITGVQLDVGSVALPYRPYAGTIQGELAACQRYYQRITADQAFGAYALNAAGSSTTNIQADLLLPVPMRAIVSSIDYLALSWIVSYGAGTNGISVATLNTTCTTSKAIVLDLTTTGVSSGTRYRIVSFNNASGYLGFNAEL